MIERHPRMKLDKAGDPLPKTHCLKCGKVINAAARTVDNDDDRPGPGDVAICFYCGHFMIYRDDLGMREATEDERREVADDTDFVLGMRRLRGGS